MGVRELTSTQADLLDACRRGDDARCKAWLASKKNKRPRTPLNFLRPTSPGAAWLAAIRDPASLYTALHYAALNGYESICAALLSADPYLSHSTDKRGCVPLHLAAWNGHMEVVRLLTERDPGSIDAVNSARETPLHLAAQHGHAAVAKRLLEHNADAHVRNARCESPLDMAARMGHADVCRLLLAFCPELTLQAALDSSSSSENHLGPRVVYPLHAAARHSHIACMQTLEMAGFDLSYSTEEGSALHVAAQFGQVDAVRFLLKQGIDAHIRDARGRTALQLLTELEGQRGSDLTHIIQSRDGWSECARMIRDYTADCNTSCSDAASSGESSDVVWRPLPTNSNARYLPPRAKRAPPKEEIYKTCSLKSTDDGCRSSEMDTLSLSTAIRCDDSTMSTRGSTSSHGCSPGTLERRRTRFPITSPLTNLRHVNSRRGDGLSERVAAAREQAQAAIGSRDCVYKSPVCARVGSTTLTYNPAFPYDNCPANAAVCDERQWRHDCGGSARFTRPPVRHSITDGTQTLPVHGGRPVRQRPSLLNAFPIERTPSVTSSRSSLIPESTVSTGRSTRGNSQTSTTTTTFHCSTLERSVSPLRRPPGRAPLALPEDMGASTATSLLASSPERTPEPMIHPSLTLPRNVKMGSPMLCRRESPDRQSLRSLHADHSSDGPPSPNTSQHKIFSMLCTNDDLAEKLAHNNNLKTVALSPSNTDSTVASSCSLPQISQISSDSSPVKQSSGDSGSSGDWSGVRFRGGQMSKDRSLNESAEWSQINDIMSSFGGAICRESVFASHYEPAMATFLRDRRSNALTLTLHTPPKAVQSVSDFLHCSGLSLSESKTAAAELARHGLATVKQLSVLDAGVLRQTGVDPTLHSRIIDCAAGIDKTISADRFSYVSDWLAALQLTDYLGNFVERGLSSMRAVIEAALDDESLKSMRVSLLGHRVQLLKSLYPPTLTRVDSSPVSSLPSEMMHTSSSDRSRQSSERSEIESSVDDTIREQLPCSSFSAHYLGAVEIVNTDGTDESRQAMNKLKKAAGRDGLPPLVRFSIDCKAVSVHDSEKKLSLSHPIGHIQVVCQDARDLNCFAYACRETADDRLRCHAFSALTADVATEIIVSLGQAFDTAYQHQIQTS